MSNAIIQVQHISKSFHVGIQDIPVLKDISFEVQKGDFLVIFGPSGCGKSTLLHTILGLEEQTSGNVFLLGKNLYNDMTEDDRSDIRKKHIGMVYQQSNWIRSLTVVENVAFPLYLLGAEETDVLIKAGQILRNLQMSHLVNYFPSELSSGQQQKIALARALITNPELIIADEPTGNLDYESGRDLMKMLTLLNKNGQTVIMVTHDLNYLTYARTAIRMFDGRIVASYKGTEMKSLHEAILSKRGNEKIFRIETNYERKPVNEADFQSTVKQNVHATLALLKEPTKKKPFSLLLFFSTFLRSSQRIASFFVLLMIYIFSNLVLLKFLRMRRFKRIFEGPFVSRCFRFFTALTKRLDRKEADTIYRMKLIELSIKNMLAKKTRSVITIGGMTIGIGTIVFLVSIGYGLQRLVITRIARLEEMKQADVTLQTGGKVKINDKTLSDFKDISAVEIALPLIAVVGRVNYQNSVSDMTAYGVTTDYLKQSAIKPIEGKIFESNELVSEIHQTAGQVDSVSTENLTATFGEKIQNVDFTINPSDWIRVRESPTTNAKILGYSKRVEDSSAGEEVWGENYESEDEVGRSGKTEDGKVLGKWIKAPVLLWKEEKCDPQTQGDCEDEKYVVIRDENNMQVQKEGYFAEINLTVAGVNIKQSQVFGVTSDATENAKATTDTSVDWVEIASEAGIIAPPEIKTVELAGNAKRQAVVNRAMLKVLGISESEAVGKKFNVSFVVVGDLLVDAKEKVESASTEYTIVGVTPEEKTPVFYVPFIDLRSLGITNYSQVKVVVKDQAELAKVRRQVEAMGYVTRSVADTVGQINSLFATLRTILMLLGMVALSIAALGMFNTLTVSLLERTREVGLMKAMGMKSSEVQELFLTESMIMGFFGGVLGIVVGFIMGELAGLALSFFTIFKGLGFVNISYVPFSFIVVIVFLSLLVGIATGIYPAKRATKISALNALRYE